MDDLIKRTGFNTSWEEYADNFKSREGFGLGLPDYVTEEDAELALMVQNNAWKFRYCENTHQDSLEHYLKESAGNYISELL